MSALWELRPLVIVLLTPLASLLILVSGRRPNLREAWTLLASLAQAVLVLSLAPGVLRGESFELRLLTLTAGLDFVLRVDPLGMVFAGVSAILWVATSVYSIGYMRTLGEGHQTPYFAAFAMCVGAATGVAFSGNLLTFLVFYELLTIATYPLVVHKRSDEAVRAGRKYLAYTLSAGLLLLLAIGWTHLIAPGASFVPGGFLRPESADRAVLTLLFVLFVAGVGVKAGLMPLHAWLPTAMVAPTPVSALLHAVAVVKAGVFGVIRVGAFVFGWDTLRGLGVALPLAVAAGVTILAASVIALTADNLKRRLAYSTVGQLSYIVLGVALLSPAGLTASVMHIVNHAFMKITLFFCAGAIYAHLHLDKVSQLKGIGRAMPVTMTAFAVAAAGLAGIPPLPGFVSKLWLATGAVEGGQLAFLFVLVGSSVLSFVYFAPIVFNAFFAESPEFQRYDEAPWTMVGPIAFTAVSSVVLGLAPGIGPGFWELATRVAGSVAGGGP